MRFAVSSLRPAHFQAERQLILLSAGTLARRRAGRERAWQLMEGVNWRRLAERLSARKLMPPLGPRILELAEGRESEDFAVAVDHAIAATRRQSTFLQLVCQRVVSVLADAGIRSTPLKGVALGEAIYGDPGRRLSSDIDLLVAPEQLHQAVEVVQELGYVAPEDPVDRHGLPLLHFGLVHERGELPPVELHWRIHWYERSFAQERLLTPVGCLRGDWHPAPADELAALLLFYARDGFVDLRLTTDLSAWWDIRGSELSSRSLDDLLSSYPALARAIVVAARVAESTAGLPRLIGDALPLSIRDHMALRLANPNPHSSQSQLYADMGLIDGLLMPRGDLGAFVRRHVLVPSEVLDGYARRAPRWRAKSSLDYGIRVLARYGLAMMRAVRAPETLR